MAPYAGFFYVYCTAIVLLEVFVGAAFAVRGRAESSRKMAVLAVAFAWSAPMAIFYCISLPGIVPELPAAPPQVAPTLWFLWHAGWPLVLLAYASLPERAETRVTPLIPMAFAAALAASAAVAAIGTNLPVLVGAGERFEPAFRVAIASVLVLDLLAIARLVRPLPNPRDRWVVAAIACAALEAVLMLVTIERFTPPFYAARIAGVAGALAMLGALVVDGFAVLRRAAQQIAERDRLAEIRAVADMMPQIVWQLGADNRNVYANERWTEYTGRERPEGSDGGFRDAIHPDDREARDRAFAAAQATGSLYESTYRLRGGDGAYRYFLTRAVPIVRDGAIAGWVGTSTDIEERKQAELAQATAFERESRDAGRMRTLSSIGRALSQSLDLEVVCETAVTAPVPQLADWALLNLCDEQGRLVVVAAHHGDPERAHHLRRLIGNSYVIPNATGGSVEVVANASGLRVATLNDDLLRRTVAPEWLDLMLALEPRSCVVVPLLIGDSVRGTLNLNFAESGRSYDADDLEMLEEVGRRIALAIENAEFYAREHRVAERLQRASLPATLPAIPGVLLDAVYQAGQLEAQIGGDWYDAFELDDGRLIVSVGDVMGSGLEAAATMGAVRQAVRGAAEVVADPVAILHAADRALQKTQPDGLVTSFVGILDPGSGVLTYATAGHPAPFLQRPDGSVERLVATGLPLGLRDERPPEPASTAVLEDGALLVLYTDGLTEAGRDIDAGESRLRSALARLSANDRPAETLRRDVLGVDDEITPRDDVAILTVGLGPARHRRVTDLRCDVRDGNAVRRVRSAVVSALQHRGVSEESLFDAELVLGELLGNVMRHAPPIAEIRLDLRGPSPLLCVLDRGPGCSNAVPQMPGDAQESGRGLYVASQLVSELAIDLRAGGGTEIRATLRA